MALDSSKSNILYGGMPSDDIKIKEKSFGELIINKLNDLGDQVILVNGNTDEEFIASQLLSQSLQVAKSLQIYGIDSTDMVGIISENRMEFLSVWFGTSIAGSIFAPLNMTYSEGELKHLTSIAQPKILFTSNDLVGKIMTIFGENCSIKTLIVFDLDYRSHHRNDLQIVDFSNFLQKSILEINSKAFESRNTYQKTTLILSSSGTTGLPKCVEHTDHLMFEMCKRFFGDFEEIEKNHMSNVRCVPLPWFHMYGLTMVGPLILSKFKVVYFQKYRGKDFLRAIEKYKIDCVYAVPPIFLLLSKSPLVSQFNLSSLRALTSGAASLSKDVIESIQKRLGPVIIRQGFGMTEIMNVMSQFDPNSTPGSCGKLKPGVWGKVIDAETGRILGPDEVGEFVFKGGATMKGYLNNPKATREFMDEDGWCNTGDIGYYNQNDEWFLIDRSKELIKYKGYQVPPAELEALLLTHPQIDDVGVVGIPNEVYDELATAFVVLKPNVVLTEKEICDFVAERISPAKRLYGGVKFLDVIPKSNTGKILRRVLKKMASNGQSKL